MNSEKNDILKMSAQHNMITMFKICGMQWRIRWHLIILIYLFLFFQGDAN